jgi:hypothetical protein
MCSSTPYSPSVVIRISGSLKGKIGDWMRLHGVPEWKAWNV